METKPLTDEILEAARKLLLQKGLEYLSMRKIATEVGCKAATIYYYYKNKEAIVEALMEEGNRLHYIISKEIAKKHANPLLRFEALLWTTLEFGLNNPAYFELLHLNSSAKSNASLEQRIIPAQELGRQALQEAKTTGLIQIQDPGITCATVFAMLNGVIDSLLRSHFYPELNREEIKKEAIQRIMDSLKR